MGRIKYHQKVLHPPPYLTLNIHKSCLITSQSPTHTSLEGILSKSTLLCGDGRVCVHCHSDCNPLSDCRHDCSLGLWQPKLGATWFTWVTVAMSTGSVSGTVLVAFGWRFWGSGMGFGWTVCRRVGVHGLQNALPRVPTICGWLGTHVGCHWRPPGHYYLGHFLSFPLMDVYSTRVCATQA